MWWGRAYMQSAFSADDISLSRCLRADTLNQHSERSTHWCQSVRPGSEELDWRDSFQTPTSWKAPRSRKKETGSGSSVDKWYWRTWTSPDTHSSWDKRLKMRDPPLHSFLDLRQDVASELFRLCRSVLVLPAVQLVGRVLHPHLRPPHLLTEQPCLDPGEGKEHSSCWRPRGVPLCVDLL